MEINLELRDEEHRNLFPNKLSEAIAYRKSSNARLGKAIKKSSGTLFNWRNKLAYYTVADLCNICEVFELDLMFFFDKDMLIEEADLRIVTKIKDEKREFMREILFENNPLFRKKRIFADFLINADEETLEDIETFIKIINKRKS